jgi:DNA-binding MarR family transcriptional regulator/N-acetylglutamate synthase-like GNAT family acetyltransferase
VPPYEAYIEQIRSFNRFYTKRIGLLRDGLLHTPFSLTQARVLYELGRNPRVRSASLAEELGLDPGYLSRLLKGFEGQRLIKRASSKEDHRVNHLSLTAKGRAEFERLDARSGAEIGEMLASMSTSRRERLVHSMTAIRESLDPREEAAPGFVLRMHQPGDIGWAIARHGELYAQEYRWDSSFEGLVAEIAGAFLRRYDERRERCWIAERNGERLGCVFLVKQSRNIAKLRLLIVEPSARGLGIGARLVSECIAFASQSGYRKLTLWTNDILHAARRIYECAGFRLVKEERHNSFGHELVGQFWELKLQRT